MILYILFSVLLAGATVSEMLGTSLLYGIGTFIVTLLNATLIANFASRREG